MSVSGRGILACALAVAALWLSVSVALAADDDGDGFDDASADRCLGVEGSRQGCPRADLRVRVTVKPRQLKVGGRVVFKIVIRNLGPDEVTGVKLVDRLPRGLRVRRVRTTGAFDRSCTGKRRVRCTVGGMDPGDVRLVKIVARVRLAGTLRSRIRLFSKPLRRAQRAVGAAGDPIPGNDRRIAAVRVR